MATNWQNVELLAILATEEEVSELFLPNSNIFINKSNSLQFYVKVISTPPNDFPSTDPHLRLISCFSTGIPKDQFYDDRNQTEDDRIEQLFDTLENKLISINIEEKEDYHDPEKLYYNGKIHEIIAIPSQISEVKSLHPAPLFTSRDLSFEELMNKLQENKFVGKNEYISNEIEDYPAYIFYKDENEDLTVIGLIDSYEANGIKGYRYNFDEDIKYSILEEKDYENIIITKQNVAYYTTELSACIDDKLKISIYSAAFPSIQNDKEENEEKENIFINYLLSKLRNERLLYDDKDIINFHTAMKTSNLVILSGMSGTGKSQLVKSYAEALNLGEKFKFISVSPSWTEDSDIIGYPDTLNMIYRSDDHGLVETLIKAHDNPEELFIICFDEMNLARIEHYFSQFLSLLESDVNNRFLRLYNKELVGRLYNSEKYSSSIQIGANVRFVGTVNIDDSTHHFSDKVLDRANLITLNVMPFKDLVQITHTAKDNLQNDEKFSSLYVNRFIKNDKKIELSEETIEFLQALHDVLSKIGKQTGIGPRIIKQIDLYMKNIPINTDTFTKEEAIDLQVVQRILSKLRGSQEQLEEFIGHYDPTEHNVASSKLINLFNDFSTLSNFRNSKKLIIEKAKELSLHGYTF